MAIEIERKYLVANTSWRDIVIGDDVRSLDIVQAYIGTAPERTIRIRITRERSKLGPCICESNEVHNKHDAVVGCKDCAQAWLTIKGKNHGLARAEFEYAIPVEDARQMVSQFVVGRILRKTRYVVPSGLVFLEIDEYKEPFDDLVLLEVEFSHEDEVFELPAFVGKEVSTDFAYTALALSQR